MFQAQLTNLIWHYIPSDYVSIQIIPTLALQVLAKEIFESFCAWEIISSPTSIHKFYWFWAPSNTQNMPLIFVPCLQYKFIPFHLLQNRRQVESLRCTESPGFLWFMTCTQETSCNKYFKKVLYNLLNVSKCLHCVILNQK